MENTGTEIGLLPKDWLLDKLGNIADVTRLAGYEYSEYWQEDPSGQIITLRGFNVGCNKIIEKDFVRISNELSMKLSRSRLYIGDIVYPCVGTIGNAVVIRENDKYHINQNIAKITPKAKVDSDYLAYYLMSHYCTREMRRFNATSSQPNVLVGSLRNYRIPLPPLPEQKKIAQILSTWDKAIELLEKKIALKEELKKGLMQQLLTGKKRFKEFGPEAKNGELPQGWREVRLGDVFERIQEKAPKGIQTVLSITSTTGFVDQQIKFSRLIAGKQLENYVHLKHGDFSYNKGNSKTYPMGCVFRLDEFPEGAVPNVYISFRPKPSEQLDSDFYSQYFKAGMLNRQLNRLINAGVRNDGLLNLNAEEFFSVRIKVPPLAEQQKVGRVLVTLEREIALLRQKVELFKAQKKGLMQQLLTGKVRVKT